MAKSSKNTNFERTGIVAISLAIISSTLFRNDCQFQWRTIIRVSKMIRWVTVWMVWNDILFVEFILGIWWRFLHCHSCPTTYTLVVVLGSTAEKFACSFFLTGYWNLKNIPEYQNVQRNFFFHCFHPYVSFSSIFTCACTGFICIYVYCPIWK